MNWNSEKDLEKAFTKEVDSKGGLCLKLIGAVSGLPDRIVLQLNGNCFFVEFKSKGQKPRALQSYWHENLRSLGFKVYVVDSEESYNNALHT